MRIQFIRMLQYENISVSEGLDTNKTSASKECMLCDYWYFKDVIISTFKDLDLNRVFVINVTIF